MVLLCFVAATTFWLLNALNKSYSTQITYPIHFVYNENNLVPIKSLPEEVTINVTGKGWKLFRKSLRLEVQPAEIYIKSLPSRNYLLGSALRPALVNALDGMELNFVVTDTVYFNFDRKITRTVGLKLDPKQKVAADQFAQVGPVKFSPDSVTFIGPSSMVDSIANPFLVRLPTESLTASAQVEVPLNYDYKALVKSNVNQVRASVNIRNLVQEERQLLPELVNVPAQRELSLRPPFVLVRYQLLADSVATLNREAFKVVLDFAKFNPLDSTIVPELVQMPSGVRNITLRPERVKAILERQND
ncbi:hypothetical protein LN893_00355 [Pontibacter sp. XAAS-A31]|nr:hypothetical protein [Pontibacter harenae]